MANSLVDVPRDALLRSNAETSRTLSDQQLWERFVARRDEAAFSELVHRFGRSVWGICRRMLRQEQDAEDAFQAVFLILARKAGSIRKGEAVGSWLYGVAYQTAMKARQSADRRHKHEMRAGSTAVTAETRQAVDGPPGQAAFRELQGLLDEEVQRLAQKYRAPFVLCCLQGMSKAEAARELGWKEGTVSGRLAMARKQLQKRLALRGVTISAALTTVALGQTAASASVPPLLLHSTIQGVLASLANAAGAVSPAAAALATSVLRTMAQAKLKVGILLSLGLMLLLGGASLSVFYFGAGDGELIVKMEPETFLAPPAPIGTLIDEQVLALAFSPDGKQLVTAGARHTLPGQLKIWDVDAAKELASIKGISGVRTVAYSPDGQLIATGDFSGTIKLRDGQTGLERASFKAHNVGINSIAFSADGMQLVSAGLDRIVKISDVPSLQERQKFIGHTDMIFSVAAFRHGKGFVTGAKDNTVRIWDIAAGKEKFTLKGHTAAIEAVAISPNDKIVATASWDNTIRLWDAENGKELGKLEGNETQGYALAFSKDGDLLAVGGMDGSVRLWDMKTRKPVGGRGKHREAVWSVAFSPDTKLLASGSSDRTAKLWNVATLKLNAPGGLEPVVHLLREVKTLSTSWSSSRPILAAAYSPDGKVLGVATQDNSLHIRDAKSGDVLQIMNGHTGAVTCLAFSPDGSTLASGSTDRTIRLWDRTTGKAKLTLTGHTGGVFTLSFLTGGKRLASGGEDKIIRLWDTETGKETGSRKGHEATVYALAFFSEASGANNVLASGSADKTIKLWNLIVDTETKTLTGHEGAIRALAFSRDGRALASGGEDSTLKLWDTVEGKIRSSTRLPNVGLSTLRSSTRLPSFSMLNGANNQVPILALAFSPGGRTLVCGGQDRSIWVWDPASGQLRAGPLLGHRDAVTALAIHPLGDHLISGSLDTTLLRWRGAKASDNLAGPSEVRKVDRPSAATDRRITADSLPARPVERMVTADSKPAASADGRGWMAAGFMVGLIITSSMTGVWMFVRATRGAVELPATSSTTALETTPETPAFISFSCSGCQKTFKVKAELAGKKAKCPQCGFVTTVPVGPAPMETPPPEPRPRGALLKKRWLWCLLTLPLAALVGGSLFLALHEVPKPTFVNVNLGGEFIAEVPESGFHAQQYDPKGQPYRWTNGTSRLTIPVDPKNPPYAMKLHLWPWRPPQVEPPMVRIVVNQQELLFEKLTRNRWQKTLELNGIDIGSAVNLEIISDTFVPNQIKDGGPDTRTLEVGVLGVELVAQKVD